MKTAANKRKNIVWSMVLVVILIAACIFPSYGIIAAKADDGNNKSYARNACKDLYYISDNDDSKDLCADLLNDCVISSYELYYWDYESFWSNLQSPIYEFEAVCDAKVIFELKWGFDVNVESPDRETQMEILYEFFGMLKSHGCYIMFICGLEEELYKEENSFLDYVDIHINTDIFTIFLANILDKAETTCGSEKIENCTFILDRNMLSEQFDTSDFSVEIFEWYRERFFRNYFLTYIKTRYKEEILYYANTVMDITYDKNIYVLFHVDGNRYYDIFGMEIDVYECGYFYQMYINDQRVYAIGATSIDENYTRDWIDSVINLLESMNYTEIEIYIYNSHGYDFTDCYDYEVYSAHAVHYSDYYFIVIDFLFDLDLSQYDNFAGRCIVTHKVMRYGPEGWMDYYIYGEDRFYVDGWKLVMNEDECKYYYGLDNIFG